MTSNIPEEKVFRLPTLLKRQESVISGSSESDADLNPYLAAEKIKRHLIKDESIVSGRCLDVFSSSKDRRNVRDTVEILDETKRTQMPGVRMPNTERQPDPPPPYQDSRQGRRSQSRPPRYQQSPQQGQIIVYYVPSERRGPDDTRDYGPYRPGRNPTRMLVDRQYSEEYLFDKQLRKQFVFKVYLILSVLLAFTFTCCIITTCVPQIKHFFIVYWWLSIIFIILYMVFCIALMCVRELRRSYPTNLILLSLMCLCVTVPLCVSTAFYSTKTVLLALGTTLLITLTISFLAKVAPFDVTGCGMLVLIISLVFCFYGLITFIVSLFIYEPLLHLIYGAIGTVVFSFFLFFDTQQILGGRRVELSHEEYILGVVLLYIDIIMIFLMLLNVYGYAD